MPEKTRRVLFVRIDACKRVTVATGAAVLYNTTVFAPLSTRPVHVIAAFAVNPEKYRMEQSPTSDADVVSAE